ncbi:MAG: heavy-metal-associated domain-containing protein [Gemmatimonadetes bacterium]|nr:heavy-metal-associated domain-containing protein [Gemmatimonadota bacterium]
MRSVLKLVSVLAMLGTGLGLLRAPTESQLRGQITIRVPGVPGPYCVYGIEKRLTELPEVADVQLLWEEDQIRVNLREGAAASRERIKAAIEGAEYPYAYTIDL